VPRTLHNFDVCFLVPFLGCVGTGDSNRYTGVVVDGQKSGAHVTRTDTGTRREGRCRTELDTHTWPTVMAWGTTWKSRPGSLYRLDKKGEVP
jgi:hypothetical protein